MSNESSPTHINIISSENAENNNVHEKQKAAAIAMDAFEHVIDMLKQNDEVLISCMVANGNLERERRLD